MRRSCDTPTHRSAHASISSLIVGSAWRASERVRARVQANCLCARKSSRNARVRARMQPITVVVVVVVVQRRSHLPMQQSCGRGHRRCCCCCRTTTLTTNATTIVRCAWPPADPIPRLSGLSQQRARALAPNSLGSNHKSNSISIQFDPHGGHCNCNFNCSSNDVDSSRARAPAHITVGSLLCARRCMHKRRDSASNSSPRRPLDAFRCVYMRARVTPTQSLAGHACASVRVLICVR